MNKRTAAEIAPPGEFLKEELVARNWSQQELSDILDRPPRLISEIIGGKRAITPETAYGLGQAFGTSAETWLALESQYQLSKLRVENDQVARKARLYDKFPVRELLRRGWVRASDDLKELERAFCEYFGIPDMDATPSLSHAAKKTHATDGPTIEQLAWLFRVRSIAASRKAPAYSPRKLLATIESFKAFRPFPEQIRKVPDMLYQCGVRVVLVEPIAGSKIDGACFWMKESPVVGMTLRFDRIDNFWFVLRHELEHVIREDGKEEAVIDTNVGEDAGTSKSERIANDAAGEFCVPQDELEAFIEDVRPYFSEEKVLRFASDVGVHPGLVVGQIQRRLDRHDFLRKYQVKVRAIVLESAQADGWGVTPS